MTRHAIEDDLGQLEQALDDNMHAHRRGDQTHWHGCHLDHPMCAARWAVTRLRKIVDGVVRVAEEGEAIVEDEGASLNAADHVDRELIEVRVGMGRDVARMLRLVLDGVDPFVLSITEATQAVLSDDTPDPSQPHP